MAQLSLFISCVSNEFAHYRDAMRKDLSRTNLTTQIQEDFIPFGASILQKLDEYIQHCDAVIHICGNMTGSMANALSMEYIIGAHKDFGARFPDLLPVLEDKEQLSYTQWEAWLAAYYKKTLIIAQPSEEATRHSSYEFHLEQKEHQQLHLRRLRTAGYYDEINFSTTDELIKKIYQSSLLELLSKLPATKPINLPYHSIANLFMGRENDLNMLYTEMQTAHKRAAAIVGSSIHGLGGIGKTRLAIEYAWRYQNDYNALLFVAADSPEKLFSNLAALSARPILNLPEQHAQEEQIKYDAVKQWLNGHAGWLLILDNADGKTVVEEVETLFAGLHGGHILITSRQTNWGNHLNPLPLDILEETPAVSFLLERTKGKRRKSAEDESFARLIAADLGYLALALEQAGAFIYTRRLTLAQYRQAWQTNHDQVLEWYDERLMAYPYSLAVTWQTSVLQLSADAKKLLDRLAWLAPDPTPESLLNVQVYNEHNIDYDATLSELNGLSLVNRLDTPFFTVHRLVQDVTRRKQHREVAEKNINACLNWIDKAFVGDPADITSWPALEPLVPHALAVTANQARLATNTRAESRLLNQLGVWYLTKAQFGEAEPLMRRALQIDEEGFGKNHPIVAGDLSDLAQLLQATNRLEEAEPLMRRALQIGEQSFPENHPDVARDLNNLAHLLKETNRLSEAEPLMRRALQIDEQSFGENHPDVARDLSNFAQLLKVTNRLAEAEPLMRRALQIDEQKFGINHPHVARRLNNLAQLLDETNRLAEAELLMRRALEIDEQSFGKNHPDVARDLNNLAQLLKVTNRLVEAEPLMLRALQIDEQSFGQNHPNVAGDLNNLAQLFKVTNRLAEAEPLMRRALQIDEQSFGKNHPHVARDLNNLALLLQVTNRLTEAEPLMQRALQIDEQSFGENHPKAAIRLNNLAQLLQATHRQTEAEPLMRRALQIDEQSLGENHPKVAIRLNNLAQLLKVTNRLMEAEPLMRRMLQIVEQSFGQNHPRVAIGLNNLALLFNDTSRPAEAEPLMRRALQIDELSFGENHPDVARDLNNLAQLFEDNNRLAEAEPLRRRALQIYQHNLRENII
jgi:hypothetical protein